jgi:hypothetical protein
LSPSKRFPVPLLALLVSAIPFVTALAMLGLQAGVGPTAVLYWIAQTSVISMALIVVGSGLALAALVQAERHDWRIYTAFALQALAIVGMVMFLA